MEPIILEDNPHWLNSEVYNSFQRREVLEKAISLLHTKEVLAIIGARRVGKSTVAKLLINELLKDVDAKNIFFINLEKPDFIPYKKDASYLNKLYDAYLKLANPDTKKKIYFFIDEIQIFQNWEVFVKSKYENSNVKFIITGSNSSLLTSNYSTVLTGRVFKLQVHSFSFVEFLKYKKIPYLSSLEQVANKIDISRAKDEYLKWGGYYSVISNSDESIKKEYLKNVAEDIILKDIVPRYNIKNSAAIKDLYFYVISNATTSLNYSTLAKKIGIDAKMIKEYIGHFEDNFLITTVSAYHNKLTQQIKSTKKIYSNDNGFLNLGINRNKNSGNILENMVFTIFNQKGKEITYVKDNYEIDFCVDNDELYQVSYDISEAKTKSRELNAFKHLNPQNHKKNILITYDTNEENDSVKIISLEKFIFECTQ
ncbi:MAG: ATP-binding protein [Sulfurimonas sp.]|nr:ATP-binding protein [Sulfurimonas sp.]